jgi:hypothetical protein
VGPHHLRHPGPGHRQRRDHRPLRDRGAEGAYLLPLLNGECFSSYSMTEPQAGSDPQQFTCRAVKDGDEWVINGWKYFSSNARTAAFLIVMAITDPDVKVYKGASMFLVPTDTPGVEMVRHVGLGSESEDEGMHALIHYNDVRVPADSLLGGEGEAFAIAQTRLGGGTGAPRHAHRRRVPVRAGHAVRAGAEPGDPGHPAGPEAIHSGRHRRLLRRAPAVPAARPLHGLGDRPVPRLPQDPQEHRRHQGAHAQGRARRGVALHARPRCPRRLERDAVRQPVDRWPPS